MKQLSGLQRMCKAFGQVKIGDVLWVWDYAKDEPRKAKEMTKEEKLLSEKARYNPEYVQKMKEQFKEVKKLHNDSN